MPATRARCPSTSIDAVEHLILSKNAGACIAVEAILSLLRSTIASGNACHASSQARRIHSLVQTAGFSAVPIIQDHLIRLYAVSGNLYQAHGVFSQMLNPSSHTWYAMIASCVKLQEGRMALDLFHQMMYRQGSDANPMISLLLAVLKACGIGGEHSEGRILHSLIVEDGSDVDLMIGNTLIDVYAKCGLLEDSQRVFDLMSNRDVVSWNVLISGYAQHGYGHVPLELLLVMQRDGIKPCKVTYSSILKACAYNGSVFNLQIVHQEIIKDSMESDAIVGNTLLDMYAKSGMFKEMQTVFDGMKNRTIVSWCTITAGYAGQGHIAQVLSLFSEMIHNCIKPNHVILSCVLRACGGNGARMHGTLIHDFIIRNNLHSDLITGNTLIDMYIRCGTIEDAWKAFIAMPKHDPVSWNTMISGYASEGYYIDALRLLGKMQQEVDHVGKPLALCIIKACTGLGVLHKSKLLHSLLLETGEESDIMIQNTLVDMYAKCGSLEDAHAVFDNLQVRNLVSWGAIISAYATHGQFDHAFQLLIKMQLTGRRPNDVIYLSLLRLCKSSANVSDSRLLHDQIIKTGFETVIAVGNALIDMYASYGSLDEGKRVLDTLPARDEVSWGAMLDGCARNGDGFLAIELFEKMQKGGLEPNRVILLLVLKSCGIIGAVTKGHTLHNHIIDFGLVTDIETGTTLIDMYSNCGCLRDAHTVLEMLPSKDASSWNALIAGYSQHGDSSLALQCLKDMQSQGLKPDSWTFTNILSACSHAGQVEKGYNMFMDMRESYNLMPRMEHFNCLIDILGRVGRLDEAEKLLRSMPKVPNVTGWLTLLTACRTFGRNELGRICYREAVCLDAEKASLYMLMSNICQDV